MLFGERNYIIHAEYDKFCLLFSSITERMVLMKKDSHKTKQQTWKEHLPDRFTCTIFCITFLLFIASIVFAIIARNTAEVSRMIFNAFSCFIMLVLILLPVFAKKFFQIKIPKTFQIIYVMFAFCGTVLGDVINFFDKFKHWDSLLHFFSGILLALLGFVLINTLNKADSVSMHLSPIFVAVSVLCFAIAIGAVWEIIEYTFDDLFGTNAQTFLASTTGSVADANAVPLVGHEALADTMWDLILDAAGAVIVAVFGFIQLKHEKKGIVTASFHLHDDDGQPAETETTNNSKKETAPSGKI